MAVAEQKVLKKMDKRLADTASILSVPGLIAGGQNAYC